MSPTPLRARLRDVVESQETRAGRVFDWVVIALIIFSLMTFSLETLPRLPVGLSDVLHWTEVGIVALFSVEYLLRVWVAGKPLKFVFSFYGIVDLIAILPTLLALGLDLRSARAFRFVRVLRLMKLARYSYALSRFRNALVAAREELVIFSVFTAVLLWLAAVGIYYFEHEAQPEAFASVFHSLWWSVATLTTVGYGDIYPIPTGGQAFTFLVLMIGLGIVAVPAGILASALARERG